MPRGVLKCWTARNHFGFIVRPNEKDLFAHRSDFAGEPLVGSEFEYEIGIGPNGRECAAKIKPVGD